MNKKTNIDELKMDMQTFSKVKGKLNPQEKKDVVITGDKPAPATSSSTGIAENEPEAVIEPKDKATIKYLSNVKDAKTGEISKPFTIGDKRYQMVRGQHPTNGVVMGVYCFDDLNEAGENIIHPVDYFDECIATPMKEQMGMMGADIQPVPEETNPNAEQNNTIEYLNLADVRGYKYFFVNIKTGEITAKFKSVKEFANSRQPLGLDDDFMDEKELRKFRLKQLLKRDEAMNEEDTQTAGTDVNKLQADVKKLTNMIKNKFSVYLSKLDKPIEQAQFLTSMAAEIGVPLNKLSTIISSYKDIAKTDAPVAEGKVITKKKLEESLGLPRIIKTIKVKDIK